MTEKCRSLEMEISRLRQEGGIYKENKEKDKENREEFQDNGLKKTC